MVSLPLSLDRVVDTDKASRALRSVPGDDLTERDKLQLLKGVRVLFVDDEPDARELVEAILGDYGAEALTAKSCTEALGLVPKIRPDVLVSDIGMPDKDGYDLMSPFGTFTGGGVVMGTIAP